jgi:hypothetical protein
MSGVLGLFLIWKEQQKSEVKEKKISQVKEYQISQLIH